jgi:hypothetical protein
MSAVWTAAATASSSEVSSVAVTRGKSAAMSSYARLVFSKREMNFRLLMFSRAGLILELFPSVTTSGLPPPPPLLRKSRAWLSPEGRAQRCPLLGCWRALRLASHLFFAQQPSETFLMNQ